VGLRVYLTSITATGYTYGALATPIAFLLFAFFLGFAIMLGAELNAAVQEEWPAPVTHARRLRGWIGDQAESLKDAQSEARKTGKTEAPAEKTEAPADGPPTTA
jgi:membrane protein